MESKDLEAEIHPLKNDEGKGPEGLANCTQKEAAPKKLKRLSQWRTAAFFLSLFLCLTVVFAFSFIIPCPVRPISQRMWSRTYEDAATYAFLALRDVNKDRVQDVLFAFKAANANSNSTNSSCSSQGLASPCAFLAAHSGTNGSTLWQRPVAQELLLMDCSGQHEHTPACLIVGEPDILEAISLETGQTLWKEPADLRPNSTVLSPLLKIPDVNGDGTSDLLVFTEMEEEIQAHFYSGKHGTQIGSAGTLHLLGHVSYLMQVTPKGSYYVLLYTAKALYAFSLKALCEMAFISPVHSSSGLTEDPHWEMAINSATHQITLLSTGEIQYLTKMPVTSSADFLVSRSNMLELVDGQHLGSMWVTETPRILSKPVLGSYRKDEVDVILVTRESSRKKVLVIGGTSGDTEWEAGLQLLSGADTPRPATLPTADRRSIFLFWGLYQRDANGTGSWDGAQQHLYLFHPALPNVLLEASNGTEHIVAFEGVLFERSRHACYVLLTGPQVGQPPGQVVLSKQKLKEAIAGSRVIWLNQVVQDSEQNVREHFLRMRYRSPR
ncbi:protein FAM234A [Zootoca vivipara]|uniref:protein FAM234A n=1 Tax=Zootoca vivipara TaxID=8524 RepID=UPI00293BD1EA|nr:protein FAM234A [Zootoca vivipara]XP_034987373.2 protein FAM234A [Zootoca vivipara]